MLEKYLQMCLMINIVKFPKRLKWVKETPLLDFYQKVIISAGIEQKGKFDVTQFKINPNDECILKDYIVLYVKRDLPYIKKAKIDSIVAMHLLCYGPNTSDLVAIGTVQFPNNCFITE